MKSHIGMRMAADSARRRRRIGGMMSIERCGRHGHYDTDFYTACPRCEEVERYYYEEALDILHGLSMMLPEKQHLIALHEYHECKLIQITNDLEKLKRDVLRGA
jgi:hypothetical protein